MKTVLISGANRGIGLETAKKFSQQGYRVFLGSKNYENGLHVTEELKNSGYLKIIPISLDTHDQTIIDQTFEFITQYTPSLEVLINNAEICGQQSQSPTILDMDNIKEIYETNLFGSMRLTKTMIPLLRKSPDPRIVNVSRN